MRSLIIAALALAAFAHTADAQQAPRRQISLANVTERPAELSQGGRPYAELLATAVDGLAAYFPAGCTRIEGRSYAFADIGAEDAVTRQVVARGQRIYRERMVLAACGRNFMPNFYVFLRPNEVPAFATGVPGETFGTLGLLRDVEPAARNAAARAASCQDTAVVIHSTVTQHPPAANAPWAERWILRACDRRVDLPIRFTPQAQGVRYEIDSANAQLGNF
ncbi:MAG: hypothetical protein AB7J28_15575 [Hyphomonadaceae bacterium]